MEDNCSICLETIDHTDIKSLGCNHSFHINCIDEWLKIRRQCPLCRHYENRNDMEEYEFVNYLRRSLEDSDNQQNDIYDHSDISDDEFENYRRPSLEDYNNSHVTSFYSTSRYPDYTFPEIPRTLVNLETLECPNVNLVRIPRTLVNLETLEMP
jgi:hypothetical protein